MKLFIIFGPQAVGKMTVGVELAKLTGLKLLHNHMTIDLVINFFDWKSPQFSLSDEFRQRIFEEVAASDLDGLIFTFVWNLASQDDKDYIDKMCSIFREKNADIYFVELYASLSERAVRNESEFRLEQKPTKRNLEHSRYNLADWHERYKMSSENDFYYQDNYLRIDNTNKSAESVAQEIVEVFSLKEV
jgi:cytidylate kinase